MVDWDFLLTDVPAFRELAVLEKHYGVNFTLFGGAATRLAASLVSGQYQFPDLVELAPFSSDIDLAHSGPESLSPEISSAIDEVLPAAGWVRWSVIGRSRWGEHVGRKAVSASIPVRSIEFRSHRRPKVPREAVQDISDNSVSITPNPFFRDSFWSVGGLDLEVFSALVAFNAAIDVAEVLGAYTSVPKIDDFLERFRRSGDLKRLGDHGSLRRRLRYLLAACEIRGGISGLRPDVWSDLSDLAGLSIPSERLALVLSASIEGGRYRSPELIEFDSGATADLPSDLRIDPLFEVQGTTGDITLNEGEAPSSGLSATGQRKEFIHLAWVGKLEDSEKFAAIAISDGAVWTPFSIGGISGAGYNWLRIDVGDIVGKNAASMRLTIVGNSAAAASESSQDSGPISGGPRAEVSAYEATSSRVDQETEYQELEAAEPAQFEEETNW